MNFEFHSPRKDDKKEFDRILAYNLEFSSNYAFGTPYLWSGNEDIEICIYKNNIINKYGREYNGYSFPFGVGDKIEALECLRNYSSSIGLKMNFLSITEKNVKEIEKIMPGKYRFEEARDMWDYIYSVDDLISLKGGKFHSKRNHIAKFNKLYNWSYDIITAKNISECETVANAWFNSQNYNTEKEYNALKKAFNNYKELDLFGGVLKVDNEPAAFTIGEKINKDIFLVHFEKAISKFVGAYSVINNEFCKTIKDYKYVNREEDLGIAGLRKAKLSYHPSMMVKKYNAYEV